MQKQCTNSSCRKFFTVSASGTACPWCGKQYPRIRIAAPRPKAEKRPQKAVSLRAKVSQSLSASRLLLMDYGSLKLSVIRAVRTLSGIGLADSKKLV